MKRCGRCKKKKDESEFYKNSCIEDGLSCWCKKCRREYRRKYYGWTKRYLSYEQRHRVVGRVKQKRCSRCRRWKPESQFYKKSAKETGKSPKTCAHLRQPVPYASASKNLCAFVAVSCPVFNQIRSYLPAKIRKFKIFLITLLTTT
jgi:hypothetical protein